MSTEKWQWDELFELDIPKTLNVHPLEEVVEFRLHESSNPVVCSVFSPIPGPPDEASKLMLSHFALSQGMEGGLAEKSVDLAMDDGLIAGRLNFKGLRYWQCFSMAWPSEVRPDGPPSPCTLVLLISSSEDRHDPIFDAAGELLASLRPLEFTREGNEALRPERDGEF